MWTVEQIKQPLYQAGTADSSLCCEAWELCVTLGFRPSHFHHIKSTVKSGPRTWLDLLAGGSYLGSQPKFENSTGEGVQRPRTYPEPTCDEQVTPDCC